MKPLIETTRAKIYHSTWLELAATLPTNMPGASLAIVDGPYNMRKADWDTFRDWDHFRDRPYLVLPQFVDLRATYDHLRAEYEASRAPFHHPQGVGNVWRHPTVAGAERLTDEDGAVHPCQKPLAFYDRLIRSSSRVGDTVLEPYGGTLRAAVACQRLPASLARHAIVCEPDARYIEAVRPSLEWVPSTGGQPSLFGGGQ